jgi:hypothetical protein
MLMLQLPLEKSMAICQLADCTLRQELKLTKESFQQMVLNILGPDVMILQRVTAEVARRQAAAQSAKPASSAADAIRDEPAWNTRRHCGGRRRARKGSIRRVAAKGCQRPAATGFTHQQSTRRRKPAQDDAHS